MKSESKEVLIGLSIFGFGLTLAIISVAILSKWMYWVGFGIVIAYVIYVFILDWKRPEDVELSFEFEDEDSQSKVNFNSWKKQKDLEEEK